MSAMKPNDVREAVAAETISPGPEAPLSSAASSSKGDAPDLLSPLLQGQAAYLGAAGAASALDAEAAPGVAAAAPVPQAAPGVTVGTLLAVTADGHTALVSYPGQPGDAALPARLSADVNGGHVGHEVVLMFEQGDAGKPIVMGVLRGKAGWPLAEQAATVDVDVDGQRMVVSARDRLVLSCGKASITLTKSGKVLIEGSYVSSKSSGVNRIHGGSVQLN